MTKRTLYKVVFDTDNGIDHPAVQVATTDYAGDDVIRLARLAADMESPLAYNGNEDFSVLPVKTVERLGSVFTD